MSDPYGPPPTAGGPLTQEDKTWALVAHIGTLVSAYVALGVLAPLLVMLVKGGSSPFVCCYTNILHQSDNILSESSGSGQPSESDNAKAALIGHTRHDLPVLGLPMTSTGVDSGRWPFAPRTRR